MLTVSLQHDFQGFVLDADFAVPAGLTVLFGQSGSGKTTVVNAIAGLLKPDTGRITVDDRVLFDSKDKVFLPPSKRGVGYVFQDARLFPHLTVRQNLKYGRWFNNVTDPRIKLPRIVDLLGIEHLLDRRPGSLSGGEKQRVAIGRAILSNPRMLLMDEPLAALDEARKSEILPYLERLRDEIQLPILYVTHSVAEVARLATTVVLMEAGKVSASGPTSQILSDPATAPALGIREVSSLLNATAAQADTDGLLQLNTAAGPLWITHVGISPGAQVRLRILAQDVMIALEKPQGISALNILPVTIRDLTNRPDGVLVRLDAAGENLLARVTSRSARILDLKPEQHVYAVLKAVSLAPGNLGLSGH